MPYILLIGASEGCRNVSLLIISYTLSEVARFFLLPKWAHRGSKVCLRFSRLTSIVFPTPEALLAEDVDEYWTADPPTQTIMFPHISLHSNSVVSMLPQKS